MFLLAMTRKYYSIKFSNCKKKQTNNSPKIFTFKIPVSLPGFSVKFKKAKEWNPNRPEALRNTVYLMTSTEVIFHLLTSVENRF